MTALHPTRQCTKFLLVLLSGVMFGPKWCDSSVGWVTSHEVKCCRFDSQSGHMPGLRVQSPVGGCLRGKQSMFLFHISVSFPLSLPSPLSKNKYNLFQKRANLGVM